MRDLSFNIVSCSGLCPCLTRPLIQPWESGRSRSHREAEHGPTPETRLPWPSRASSWSLDPPLLPHFRTSQALCSFSPSWVSLEYKLMALTTTVTNCVMMAQSKPVLLKGGLHPVLFVILGMGFGGWGQMCLCM